MIDVKVVSTILDNVNAIFATESLSRAIEMAKDLYPRTLVRPIKPSLNPKHNSNDVRIYLNLLEQFEKDVENLSKLEKDRQEVINQINEIIINNIKAEAELNKIPAEYQDKVWHKAWEDGHANGYYEVYLCLNSLVEIF